MRATDIMADFAELLGFDQEEETVKPMVPPLQQELELLKRSVGVDSCFDDQEPDNEPSPQDELDVMKQRAGLTPVIFIAAKNPVS